MSPIRRILLQYVNRGVTSADEIASLVGCSKRKVYYVLEGEKYFYSHEAMTLCQHFSSIGHNELSKQFLSAKYSLVPMGECKINGSLDDENAAATMIMGKLLELFGKREREGGLELCDELLDVVKRKKAEFRNLD